MPSIKLPKIIDLFSGCGGLALGFQKAGFDIAAGVELMPEACKTIASNLCWRYGIDENHLCGDITQMEGNIFKNRFGDEGCIVIGGPPCQAYSLAGRGKLKSLGENRVNINDARGYLYQDFLRFVFELNAKAVVMENVPESTNYGDKNIPEIVCAELEVNGYEAYWTVLNAADYGVPQKRERVFVLAIKKDENKEIKLPVPTNRSPIGKMTQYQKRFANAVKFSHFREPNKADDKKPNWVTVKDAFTDLPILFPSPKARYKLHPLNIDLPYKTVAQNDFQKLMRNWFGHETDAVSANAFRKNTRDYETFDKMEPGANYTKATAIAEALFKIEVAMFGYEKNSVAYMQLRNKMVPPYATDSFENKWFRLDPNKPSPTLVAHLSKDSYSHIHPWEPRGISVREAARLQSFPDDFYFNSAMSDAFKQIGNAVPPLLAYNIAKCISNAFQR